VNRNTNKGFPVLGTLFRQVSYVFFLLLPFQSALAQDQAAGEQVFQTYCLACHGIGGAQRIGPDLAGVHERRSQDWLEQFIKSPQALFDAGDETAVELFAQFNGMVMPNSTVSDQQIRDVIAYIESRSGTSTAAAPVAAQASPAEAASPEVVAMGADLFQGGLRFENSGPACNACHDVQHGSVLGGGSLAADLTSAYSRMGAAGLGAIISSAPFPAMQSAYGDKPVTEGEVEQLVAFFQSADADEDQQQTNYGSRLFISGALGAGLLFGLIPLIWRNRRIGSINQSIFDRQNQA